MEHFVLTTSEEGGVLAIFRCRPNTYTKGDLRMANDSKTNKHSSEENKHNNFTAVLLILSVIVMSVLHPDIDLDHLTSVIKAIMALERLRVSRKNNK